MSFDPEKFGQRMSAIVRDTVAREVEPLRAEITSLQKRLEIAEARDPVPGPPGEAGRDGATGRGITAATVRTDGLLIFSLSDGETLEAGNVLGRDGQDGEDGRDGVDGKDGAQGRDGRDPDPEMIRGMVLEAVAALPPPERGETGPRGERGEDGRDGVDGADGQDGTSVTLEEVAPLIAAEVERQIAELPPPENGRDGVDGRSVEPDEVRAMLDPLVHEAVAALPPAQDGAPGEPGRDGASVTVDDVAPIIAEEIERAVAAIPTPQDGRDGQNGASVTIEELTPLVSETVERAVAAIPAPRDGVDGRDGIDGRGIADLLIEREGELVATLTDGTVKRLGRIIGTDGRDGQDGRDGKGFTGGEIDRDGHLQLSLDDGSKLDLGIVLGRDGRDGLDGKDGAPGTDGRDGETFTLDDFSLEQGDDLRSFVFMFAKGDVRRSFEIKLPVVIDRGAWTARAYDQGDCVSWGGSTWIAQRDTAADEKPGSSDAWRLSVKRGRDGKSGG